MFVRRFRRLHAMTGIVLCQILVLAVYMVAQDAKPLGLEDALRFRSFADLTPISLSPDGKWAAFTVRDNLRSRTVDDRTWRLTGVRDIFTGTDVYLLNLKSTSVVALTEGKSDSFQSIWSPDSRYLAFISDRDGSRQAKLWVWDATNGELSKLSDLGVRQLGPVAWTADSKSIVVPVLPNGISAERYAQELDYGSTEQQDQRGAMTAGSTVIVFRSNKADKRNAPSEEANPWSLKIFSRDLVLIDAVGGEARTLVQGKVAGYAVAPDGERIAYSVPKRFESAGSQQTLFDLFTVNLDGTHRRLLVSDARLDYDGASFSWSPDSLSLAYYAFRPGGLETDTADYFIVSARGGPSEDVTTSVPNQTLPARSSIPLWNSSAKQIYFIRDGALWTAGVHMQASEVGRIPGRQILKLIPRSQNQVWMPQLGSTVVVTHDAERKQDGFYRVDLETGRITRLLERDDCYTCANMDRQFEVTADGQNLLYLAENAQSASDLFLADAGFKQVRRLTHLNPQYDGIKMGMASLVHWLSDDGDPLDGALLLPSSYMAGKRYPLIVWVYGGRNRSDHLDHFGLEGSGPFNLQLFATRGYAVLVPDAPQHLGTPMVDLLKTVIPGVNKVIEMGIADPNELGVIGHSYGGYSTLCLITQTKRFRAALEADGTSNLLGEYGQMDDNGAAYGIALNEEGQGAMAGTPWQYRDRYLENSPVFYLDRVETPLLIVQGADDTAVRPFLGDEIFVDLRRLGRQVEYAKYAHEDHSPLGWSYANQLDFVNRMIAWFDMHLRSVHDDQRQ